MSDKVRFGSKLVRYRTANCEIYYHWCPACGHVHRFVVGSSTRPNWTFNGDVHAPTFSPSMREFLPASDGEPEKTLCHYFLTAGVIEYCGDARPEYAGKKIPLPDIPADYGFDNVSFSQIPAGV